jgi:alcohol dehydrogenase
MLRRTAALLSPAAAVAGRAALDRDAAARRDRLIAAARDGLQQRRHPSRPKMRALIASGGGRLSWRSVPAPPPPGPDAALVRPIAVATCDLDRALALGDTPFPLPLSIGHECVAEVLEVGSEVVNVQVGDRVVVPFEINCGLCGACRAGFTSNCTGVPPLSMYGFGVGGGHWGGALADQVAVPFADAMLVPLPEGVDPVAWPVWRTPSATRTGTSHRTCPRCCAVIRTPRCWSSRAWAVGRSTARASRSTPD